MADPLSPWGAADKLVDEQQVPLKPAGDLSPWAASDAFAYGKPEWEDSSLSMNDRVANFMSTAINAGRSWDQASPEIEKRFGFKPTRELQSQYKMQAERNRASTMEEPAKIKYGEGIPGAGTFASWALTREVGRAQKRIEKGEANESDYGLVAQYERLQEIRQKESTGKALERAVIHMPALITEFAAGGTVGRGARLALAGKPAAAQVIGRTGMSLPKSAAVASKPQTWGAYAGDLALSTPFTPKIWAQTAAENLNNAPKDRGELEATARAYGAALTYGVAMNAIFGKLIKPRQGGDFVTDLAKKTGAGVFEQQVLDVTTSMVGISEGYGVPGEFAKALRGEESATPWKHLAVQTGTFAMFGAIHGMHPRETLDPLQRQLGKLKKAGLNDEQIAQYLQYTTGRFADFYQSAPKGRSEFTASVRKLEKEFNSDEYAKSLIKVIKKVYPKVPERPKGQEGQKGNWVYDNSLRDATEAERANRAARIAESVYEQEYERQINAGKSPEKADAIASNKAKRRYFNESRRIGGTMEFVPEQSPQHVKPPEVAPTVGQIDPRVEAAPTPPQPAPAPVVPQPAPAAAPPAPPPVTSLLPPGPTKGKKTRAPKVKPAEQQAPVPEPVVETPAPEPTGFNRESELQQFASKTQGWQKDYVAARESGMDVARSVELADAIRQSKAEVASNALPRKVEDALEKSSLEPDSKLLIRSFLEGASNRTIAELEGKGKSTIYSKIAQLYKILKTENPVFWKDATANAFRKRLEAHIAIQAKKASSVVEGQIEVAEPTMARKFTPGETRSTEEAMVDDIEAQQVELLKTLSPEERAAPEVADTVSELAEVEARIARARAAAARPTSLSASQRIELMRQREKNRVEAIRARDEAAAAARGQTEQEIAEATRRVAEIASAAEEGGAARPATEGVEAGRGPEAQGPQAETRVIPSGSHGERNIQAENDPIDLEITVRFYPGSDPMSFGLASSIADAKRQIMESSSSAGPDAVWEARSHKEIRDDEGNLVGSEPTIHYSILGKDAFEGRSNVPSGMHGGPLSPRRPGEDPFGYANRALGEGAELTQGGLMGEGMSRLQAIQAMGRSGKKLPAREHPRPPETRDEEELMKAVQANPNDHTLRLALADAIEENGGPGSAERAARIRRDVNEPPSESGVSHPSQLSAEQRQRRYERRDIRGRNLFLDMARENNEAELAGQERPHANPNAEAWKIVNAEEAMENAWNEFKLPANPDQAFPEGELVSLQEFGPRLYMATHDLGSLVRVLLEHQAGEPVRLGALPGFTTKSTRSALNDVEIEFATEPMGPTATGEMERRATWERQYRDGQVHIDRVMGNRQVDTKVVDGLLSFTIPESLDPKRRGSRWDSFLLSEGWRRVELENGDVRYDSPLRQQLRDEQARGFRSGEPLFSGLGITPDMVKKVGEFVEPAWQKVKDWARRFFRTGGDMPPESFEELIKNQNKVAVEAYRVEVAKLDLDKALKDIGGYKNAPPELLNAMRLVLKGDQSYHVLQNMNPQIAELTAKLRNRIDRLSRFGKKVGAFQGDVVATIDENMGIYVHRGYRVFRDTNWHKKVPDEIKNQFISWYRDEYMAANKGQDAGREHYEAVMQNLLVDGTAAENPIAYLNSRMAGQKDLSILKKLKNIPFELRQLWGEEDNPLAQYAHTVGYMSQLIHNHIFLKNVVKMGLKGGWLTSADKPIKGLDYTIGDPHGKALEYDENGKPKKSPGTNVTMSPLAGYRTTYEIKRAFEEIAAKDSLQNMARLTMRAINMSKYAKTVLSPVTHVRNFLGNGFFDIANGHWRVALAKDVIKAMRDDTPKGRAYWEELIRNGVVGQGIHFNEFRKSMDDVAFKRDYESQFSQYNKVSGNYILRKLKQGVEQTNKLYYFEDAVHKIYAYENEKVRYAKAHPGWTPEQVAQRAAKIVNLTYPTYSMVPTAIKALRKFPLAGPFVSFASEVVRTSYHTAKLAAEEMRDPATRQIGATRMAGLVAAMGFSAGIAAAFRQFFNISMDEDQAVRKFMPDWAKDTQILHLGKTADGKLRMIDLGRTDPHAYLWDAVQAGLSGGPFPERLQKAGFAFARPYIEEELLTRAAVDVARNKQEKELGVTDVYNDYDTTMNKVLKSGQHIGQTFVPGAFSQGRRIFMAGAGMKEETTGREYSLGSELQAEVSGQRVMEVDLKNELRKRGAIFEKGKSTAVRILTEQATKRGDISQQSIADAQKRMEVGRKSVYDELRESVEAAQTLGLTDREIRSTLRSAGVPVKDIVDTINGRYRLYQPMEPWRGITPEQNKERRQWFKAARGSN